MDLIDTLTTKLGVEPQQALAVAGTVLGGVEDAVATESPESARALGAQLPELAGWKDAAKQALGGDLPSFGGSSSSGLMGALKGAASVSSLASALPKLGIDAGKAAAIAPIALEFLRARLDPALVEKVVAAVPMLGGSGASMGGVASALGGLLSR